LAPKIFFREAKSFQKFLNSIVKKFFYHKIILILGKIGLVYIYSDQNFQQKRLYSAPAPTPPPQNKIDTTMEKKTSPHDGKFAYFCIIKCCTYQVMGNLRWKYC